MKITHYPISDTTHNVLSLLIIILMVWDLCLLWQRRRRSCVVQEEHNCKVQFNGFTVDLFLCEDQKTLGLTIEHEKGGDNSIDLYVKEMRAQEAI